MDVKQSDLLELKRIAEEKREPLFTKDILKTFGSENPLIDYAIKQLVEAKLKVWDEMPWYGDVFLKKLIDDKSE